MPVLLNVHGLQARFTGRETTALVTADISCSWIDANNNEITGYDYAYTVTVSSGKVYRIADTSCGRGPDTLGARETIWYQPVNPTHFLTANASTFDRIFFLEFSIPMLLFVFALSRLLLAPSRQVKEQYL
jgi:hypothetical protein